MNTGRAGLCIGVLSLAASTMVLFRAEQVAAQARFPRLPHRSPAFGRETVVPFAPSRPIEPVAVEVTDWHPELNIEPVHLSVDDPQGRASGSFHLTLAFAETIEDLQREIGLSREQAEVARRIVDATNLRIDDLLCESAVGGTSPRRAIEERWRVAREVVVSVARDGGFLSVGVKPLAYRHWTVSGRDRTYGEEIDALIREGLALIAQQLTREQGERFSTIEAAALFTVPNGGGDVE